VAYITRGDDLLVFKHVKYPEAGVQVPAGHPDEGESLESAVVREAEEETGLTGFKLLKYLGFKMYDLTEQGYGFERRHFYHLVFDGETPEEWVHTEKHPSVGPDPELDFLLYWVPIKEAKLYWDHGALLDSLFSPV
jgi:8-oxo-dGTP pyrophosphatase MutT (NUDIX family)